MTVFSADLYAVLGMATPVTLVSGVIIAGLRYPRAKEDFMKSPERGLVKFQRSNLRMARVRDLIVYNKDVYLNHILRNHCNLWYVFNVPG
jgi:hypothetical protein